MPLCSEADLTALGLPTGPRLKLMAHFNIPRTDGSRTGLHPVAPPQSDVLLGLQREVARLAGAVAALQRASGGAGGALVRAEAQRAKLPAQQRALLDTRHAQLANRHATLHAAVCRAPAEAEAGGDEDEEEGNDEGASEEGFETGRYEDGEEDKEEAALSEYAAVGRGFAHEAIDFQSQASSSQWRPGEDDSEACEVMRTQGERGSASLPRDYLEYEEGGGGYDDR